ncbi:MAG: hypothetical protein LC131_00220 [Anaerolineae bacterium]|nr:hypothetical protein [Anaerolineae bacterium]
MDNTPKSRRDALLSLIQSHYPGYHPLIAIAHIAHNDDAELRLQYDCHRTIAKYIEPELKSLEVKAEINGARRVQVSLFEPIEGEYTTIDGPSGLATLEMQAPVEDTVGRDW